MSDFETSWAVLVGIDKYSNGIPLLKTAVNDAKRFAEILQHEHHYDCLLLTEDVRKKRMEAAFRLLRRKVGQDDRVLFYFAGHGIALESAEGPVGYLIPQDARRNDEGTFLTMKALHDALQVLPCRHLLLILDCCFAGAFRWAAITRDLSLFPEVIHRQRYERFIQDPAWQVLTSAAHDQRALDVLSGMTIGQRGEHAGHSPFAESLFRGLQGDADVIPQGKYGGPGGDGVITATELYMYLRESLEPVTERQSMRQTPGLWPLNKHDKGEYILLVPGHPLNLPEAPELTAENNPYCGLSSYEERHSRYFFGREHLTENLHSIVRDKPLTIVVGASGTGKSSLVKAGLLPRIRSAKDENWIILEQVQADENKGSTDRRISAIRPGSSPLKSLASAEHPKHKAEENDLPRLTEEMRKTASAFASRLRVWADRDPNAKFVLVIDQLEELVTLCSDKSEREQFLLQVSNALDELPDRFRLVVTLRSDFEPQFSTSLLGVTAGRDRWSQARFVAAQMSQDELRDVIEKPASVQVLYFERGLVDDLINEVIQTPGALPLLSFALSELYRKYLESRADDRCLTIADFQELGGVAGSLRRRATEIYNELGARG